MMIMEAVDYAAIYIEKNLNSAITLNGIAKSVYTSSSHLQRQFKSVMNFSIMKYVRKRRLLLSRDLLLKTNLRVCDISAELSFEYEASFIRAFKIEFGMTPKQYRKKYQQLPEV